MTELAKTGDFCPNPGCPDYEQVRESGGDIIKFGHTGGDRQRDLQRNFYRDTRHDFLPPPYN